MKFLDLFEPIVFNDNYLVKVNNVAYAEFPLDICIGKDIDDYVKVPLILDGANELDAARTVLCAAVDRGIAIHDTKSPTGVVSSRLVSLMKQAARRNSGGSDVYSRIGKGVTDLFINNTGEYKDGDIVHDVKIHIIEKEVYDDIKLLYKYIKGKYPDNTTNIVIGVDIERNECFVRPTAKASDKDGLAILDNRRVLLGFY